MIFPVFPCMRVACIFCTFAQETAEWAEVIAPPAICALISK